MPNTIAHIGLHGITSRALIKNSDFKWIYLACLIPDIPWILQRLLITFSGFNPFDIRIYTMIQASLFLCLTLSALFSFFSSNSKKTFAILVLGSLLHLLLDAAQYKWANGVHLFAPFSWELTNYGFFWPNDFVTVSLTLFGLGYYIFYWKKYKLYEFDLFITKKKIQGIIFFAVLYLTLPLFFMNSPIEADNHFIKTFLEKENRVGKYIEIDRCGYNPVTNTLINFTNEDFIAEGLDLKEYTSLSIKGFFVDSHTIKILEYHVNNQMLRDFSSILGILLLILIWIKSFWDKLKRRTT
ncbi:MAG: hypothetical protein JEY94_09260 [Melioribacteraceae bacterium]|nr:hypothetical protein [Melioribacteraceae bacterium]